MISLENAKRLKELGVELMYETEDIFGEMHSHPTLSQLLEEVGKRGYEFITLRKTIRCYERVGWECDIVKDLEPEHYSTGLEKTPEDAVALALIEILEGEK